MSRFQGVSESIHASGPLVLIHGGAWAIPDAACDDHRDGLQAAVHTAAEQLASPHAAVDTATEVVRTLEGHGAFDAGCGAMLNRNGRVQLDAGLMDGATGHYGGVMAVERIAHPICTARALLHPNTAQRDTSDDHGQARLLAGRGAEAFAQHIGQPLVENDTLVCAREHERFAQYTAKQAMGSTVDSSASFLPPEVPSDTVGAVVRTANGHLCAATSTGGTPFKWPGRVGDSPLPGAGYYANETAAACATGWGEAIAGHTLCVRAVDAVTHGASPQAAAERLLMSMQARYTHPNGEGARAGLLVVAADGPAAYAFTTPRMARALCTPTAQATAVRTDASLQVSS